MYHICSYNHYHVKDDAEKQGHNQNDIYDTDELKHEYECGIYEDIVKTEQFMADIKKMDQDNSIENEKFKFEYDNFPMSTFKHAEKVSNSADPGLCRAADAELYQLEQFETIQLQHNNDKRTMDTISHVHSLQHDNQVSHANTLNCPVYVPYNEEKQNILLPTTTDMSRKENAKSLYDEVSNLNLHANSYFDDPCHDIKTFSYMHYD